MPSKLEMERVKTFQTIRLISALEGNTLFQAVSNVMEFNGDCKLELPRVDVVQTSDYSDEQLNVLMRRYLKNRYVEEA